MLLPPYARKTLPAGKNKMYSNFYTRVIQNSALGNWVNFCQLGKHACMLGHKVKIFFLLDSYSSNKVLYKLEISQITQILIFYWFSYIGSFKVLKGLEHTTRAFTTVKLSSIKCQTDPSISPKYHYTSSGLSYCFHNSLGFLC